jgi:uncharacterized protein YrrD
MAQIQIAIGADVRSKDGRSIGKVEHLIVDGRSNELAGFVADKGIFDSGRVVDLVYIAAASEAEVTLSLDEDDALALPGFVQHEYFRFGPTTEVSAGAAGAMVNIGGTGSTWVHYGPGAAGSPSTGASTFFPQAVVGEMAAQVVGPLTEGDVVLDNGTDVIDRDGERIGRVDEVLIGEDGKVEGFIVEKGRLFHHDAYVPFEWIAAITHDHVRLNVGKAQVQESKR